MGTVDEKLCTERSKQVEENKKNIKQNTDDIVDLKLLLVEMTEVTKSFTAYIKNQRRFWETDNGKLLFKALIVCGVIVLGVAIGTNIDLSSIMK